MTMRTSYRWIGAAAALVMTTSAALAHHGWAWVDQSKIFVLKGTIASIYLGNPHAQLQVKTDQGTWIVDLAPLTQATRAGFVKDSAKVGDAVTLVGHRGLSPDLAMKAKRVIVDGKTYNVYANDYPADAGA
jgi:hypothetical protein